jgi:hypothetical protein
LERAHQGDHQREQIKQFPIEYFAEVPLGRLKWIMQQVPLTEAHCRVVWITLSALQREFAATQNLKVTEEIERLTPEYEKLKEPWRFVESEQ